MHITLIAEGANGANKIWKIMALPNGCHIQFGKEGTELQYRYVPIENCTGRRPHKEALKRTNNKIGKKEYAVVDGTYSYENTDAAKHLLEIYVNTHDDDLINSVSDEVKSCLKARHKSLLKDYETFIDKYLLHGNEVDLQGVTLRTTIAPSIEWNHLIILFVFKCFEPDLFSVSPFRNSAINAKEIYELYDLSNSTTCFLIATETGVLPKLRVFKQEQVATASWFF